MALLFCHPPHFNQFLPQQRVCLPATGAHASLFLCLPLFSGTLTPVKALWQVRMQEVGETSASIYVYKRNGGAELCGSEPAFNYNYANSAKFLQSFVLYDVARFGNLIWHLLLGPLKMPWFLWCTNFNIGGVFLTCIPTFCIYQKWLLLGFFCLTASSPTLVAANCE